MKRRREVNRGAFLLGAIGNLLASGRSLTLHKVSDCEQ
jgi:hypothetical protein